MAKKEKIIGIDLGTTNSVVAIMEGDNPIVIVNEEGDRTTPSVVAFKNEDRMVGVAAKRQAITNPEQTIFSIKRFMGRRFDECGDDIQNVPYNVVPNKDGLPAVKIGSEAHTPPAISAMILQKLKRAAEKYLGQEVKKAVITVPAYFNDSERQSTKDAGLIAGLEVMRIINEPTAAALAYGMDKEEEQLVVVYDFGGGTFDVSILEVADKIVEVKSTAGDTHLGGDDVDQVLINWMMSEFKKEHGIDIKSDKMVAQRLKEQAEKSKKELSSAMNTEINLPFLTADATGPKHLMLSLSRSKFEQMIDGIIERTLEPCRRALKDAGVSPSEIDEVILVGGSTRIPLVQKKVKELFGREPNRSVNPDEVVAMGAAIQGGILSGDVTDVLLLDVTPLSLGIETMGGICHKLIPRNTTIPRTASETFSTAQDNQQAVDIQVYQGERHMAKDNKLLGQFRLEGIDPAPRGQPQVEVTFDIDANGILKVTAKDKKNGKEKNITIQGSSGLSKEDIDKAIKEAEANQAADEEKKLTIEATNKLDNEIYQVETMLNENRDKLPEQMIAEFDNMLIDARSAKDSGERSKIEEASGKLSSLMQQLSQAAQGQASAQQQETASPDAGPSSDDDVIDVEFED